MLTILTIVQIVVCVFLVIVVLLQHGKGADMGATFGGSSQTVFGAGGATTVLSKITIGAAIVFMLNCLALAYLSSSGASKSIMEGDQGGVKPAVAGSPAPKGSPAPQGSPVPQGAVVASPVPTIVPTITPTKAPTKTSTKATTVSSTPKKKK